MRADQRKFHYIYKISRNDGKYYIGMHSTDDLDDEYFGSGQLLWKSIKKHGKENHSKEILEYLSSREELKLREQQLVNEEILDDPLCMNLKLGGEGGWDHVPPETIRRNAIKNSPFKLGHKHSPITKEKISAARIGKSRTWNSSGFKNKSHSEETKRKMRKPKNIGEANSQFGTCWVMNDIHSIKIKKLELDKYQKLGYRCGRRLKSPKYENPQGFI